MAVERSPIAAGGALAPLAPGPLLSIGDGPLAVDVAPQAGGRIAQIRHRGVEQLFGYGEDSAAAIAWGCYPMVPWAGRIRRGRFRFEGRDFHLPANLGEHAIHGVAFALPWRVDMHSPRRVELSLVLPEDERWPFGGHVRQLVEVHGHRLRLELTLSAGARPMPAVLGWHPWFRKPDRLEFAPRAVYPRDAEGIATRPLQPVSPGPWDDCFVNDRPVVLHRDGVRLRLSSDCDHWVIFDQPARSTCVEPQTGPPDGFNLAPVRLEPGQAMAAWFLMEWR